MCLANFKLIVLIAFHIVWHNILCFVIISARGKRTTIGIVNYMRPCDGWIHIGGDFVTKSGEDLCPAASVPGCESVPSHMLGDDDSGDDIKGGGPL